MKLGIVISSKNPETVWNAFRYGVYACLQGDQVKTFLLGEGVESEMIQDDQFAVPDQMRQFVDSGGEILACGTCLKIRQSESSDLCPISTMADLHQLISDADKVLTF